MNAAELITFCTLKGDIDLHVRLKDDRGNPSEFYHIRLFFNDRIVSFQYYKDDNDELTFIKGQMMEIDRRLGTASSPIHGFKHLVETVLK